ncbi:MAG: hypothetical protein EP310_07640 [Bacteroidetes bacterium]|nr:MAG: hypothetical protein EP310_07640 [Bacteroidota bacterium]
MKTKVLFAVFMLFAVTAISQNKTVFAPDHIGEVKVTPPEFAGLKVTKAVNEMSLIDSYLLENVVIPENLTNYNPQGTAVVQFTVTPDGNLEDFKIINSVSWAIDREMIRVLKTTDGMWKPGSNNNQPVAMTKEVSMIFCMNNDQSTPACELFTDYATVSFSKGNKALLEKHNVNKALRCYSEGIRYLPNDKSLLLMRGICRYEVGDRQGAMEDWNRMASMGGTIDMSEYTTQIEGMKGYNELMAIIGK